MMQNEYNNSNSVYYINNDIGVGFKTILMDEILPTSGIDTKEKDWKKKEVALYLVGAFAYDIIDY